MTQKIIESITIKYLRLISSRGHEKCYKCNMDFKVGDTLYAIIRNTSRGLSKFYHQECFLLTCH